MTAPLQARDRYLAQFEQQRAHLPGARQAWLGDLRDAAMARFAALGFPTPKDEDWKYTPTAPIERREFRLADGAPDGITANELQPFLLDDAAEHLLVFVNGHFVPALSRLQALPRGVTLTSLAAALEHAPDALRAHLTQSQRLDGHAFAALNTAFMRDGAYLHLAPGAVVTAPIHLLHLSSAAADAPHVAYPRIIIIAEDNSQATIVETYAGLGETGYFTAAVTELLVGPNAIVDHYKLQQEGLRAFHVGALYARQERDSVFSSHSLSLGGALVRNDLRALLDAEGADCTLNGLYVAGGRQHVDNHTRIDHAKPHGTSRECYKGILDGMARGVFNGRVVVHPDAQKTDAYQSNKNLLLSAGAEVDTKPQLEIYADDVKCAHGATVGQLDDDAIFYLQSRGIRREDARSLLTYAFASDIVGRIKLPALRGRLERLLAAQLPKSEGVKEFP